MDAIVARLDLTGALASLPKRARILVAGATGESALLAGAVMTAGDLIHATFTGIFVPGLNHTTCLPDAACRVETFFMTPEPAVHRGQVDISINSALEVDLFGQA